MSEDAHGKQFEEAHPAPDWPDCVPPGYDPPQLTRADGAGVWTWRDACLAAQADGWRWEVLFGENQWLSGDDWSFNDTPDRYRIAHGPAEGRQVRIGDGQWIIPNGAQHWWPDMVKWIPTMYYGEACITGIYYSLPKQPAAEDAEKGKRDPSVWFEPQTVGELIDWLEEDLVQGCVPLMVRNAPMAEFRQHPIAGKANIEVRIRDIRQPAAPDASLVYRTGGDFPVDILGGYVLADYSTLAFRDLERAGYTVEITRKGGE